MTQQDTIFERFLAPIFRNFLIDREALLRYQQSKNWEQECDRFRQPAVAYPDYYQSQNFHGIKGGYLTVGAAVTYDPITHYVLPPNEEWVRQGLIDRVCCRPHRILDLGCGTGSTTLLLKQAFPQADVIGLDLSPYMLVVADDRTQQAGLKITYQQGNAEHTGFPDASFDLVTASLLFHETPPIVSCAILQECFRLLKPGGEVLILDGNQETLRQTEWLMQIFEEPYIQAFARGSVDDWMHRAGFQEVRTDTHWWIHQVTRGGKPLPYQKVTFGAEAATREAAQAHEENGVWAAGS
ncbi:class I SAM-dependent methyltransferase [Leptolyngbya sp. FACHB-711]|uniref:class I SAM-dependent methyltransferase n=1 Tax=unclassified Leptolyngbya TaxID=2650499 RepID=UPI0016823ECA|nr:class I SAM-dependent methyltransferase [Leptolyngbya sp. FACHB-711]MBD1852374.1 methyltransferase domain-containing protein [Cyanobacteria bacterium FACHB-502]MBD2027594.1 methyltransferase domain-containing protein [Leptolyngbya sp. FACHB-711]